MGSKSKTLNDLFLHQLRDLHHAERHGAKMFGKLAKASGAEALRAVLEECGGKAHTRLDQLDGLFDRLDKKSHGEPCAAMGGLIDEAKDLLNDFEGSDALDAGLLATAQAMVHYTLARVGAVAAWSARLDLPAEAAALAAMAAEQRDMLDRLEQLSGSVGASAVPEPPAPVLTLKMAALAGLR